MLESVQTLCLAVHPAAVMGRWEGLMPYAPVAQRVQSELRQRWAGHLNSAKSRMDRFTGYHGIDLLKEQEANHHADFLAARSNTKTLAGHPPALLGLGLGFGALRAPCERELRVGGRGAVPQRTLSERWAGGRSHKRRSPRYWRGVTAGAPTTPISSLPSARTSQHPAPSPKTSPRA